MYKIFSISLACLGVVWIVFVVFTRVIQPSHNVYITGHSMEQNGIHEGDVLRAYENIDPVVGDVVVFSCTAEKCPKDTNSVKVLKKYEDGCYWFEGNEHGWTDTKTGKAMLSLDSRVYGWLCGEHIKINGVIR